MARTMAAALAAVAGPKFDAAVGYTAVLPVAQPTDPAIATAFVEFDTEELHRLARRLAVREHCHPTEADDAVQNGLLELWHRRPELFREPPKSWLGLLYAVARFRLKEIRPEPARSIDALLENGDLELTKAQPCLSESHEADESNRSLTPPAVGDFWTREQILGAIQRFRDYHGRPPRSADFKAINALPSTSVLYRHFESLADAILASGMVPDTLTRRRRFWLPVAAARECRSFRRRHSRWPSWRDVKRRPGELPSTSVMIRCFGGTRAIDIQLGVEAILSAVGEQTA
jgi:DNA-directed RNA polymerase specialized sigma24 family protein